MEWIPIAEKLPPADQPVLVTDGNEIAQLVRTVGIFRRTEADWFWSLPLWVGGMEADVDFPDKNITHWMDLPSLPRSGPQSNDDGISFDVGEDEHSQIITASKTIRYAARLTPKLETFIGSDRLREILAERISIGMSGFDEALARHDARGDGQRITFQ